MRSAISAKPLARLHVSTLTIAEAWTGALKSPHRDRLVDLWQAFLEPFEDRILPCSASWVPREGVKRQAAGFTSRRIFAPTSISATRRS